MKQNLLALLILCVTLVLLAMILAGNSSSLVVIAAIIILTVLILAIVNEVDKLSEVLKVILSGLCQIFLATKGNKLEEKN